MVGVSVEILARRGIPDKFLKKFLWESSRKILDKFLVESQQKFMAESYQTFLKDEFFKDSSSKSSYIFSRNACWGSSDNSSLDSSKISSWDSWRKFLDVFPDISSMNPSEISSRNVYCNISRKHGSSYLRFLQELLLEFIQEFLLRFLKHFQQEYLKLLLLKVLQELLEVFLLVLHVRLIKKTAGVFLSQIFREIPEAVLEKSRQ